MNDVFTPVSSSAELLLSPDMRVLVQGINGRAGRTHAAMMRRCGTNLVAGVSRSAGSVDGVPVYPTCAQAIAATGAVASIVMVSPLAVAAAVEEAIDAGIKLVVTVAEGVPVADAVRTLARVRAAGARWIGASTPGIAIPGRLKLGFLPDVALAPGRLGVMSKSGTLSYEICYRLVARGLGQSLWVGVGGDPVKGTRFCDLLPVFAADPNTTAVVVIGEIGGSEEEELAAAMRRSACPKPVFALVAGRTAREGLTMGHAGALVHGGAGTFESKRAALIAAGAQVFARIQDLVDAVAASPASSNGDASCS
jgi:succinyl-CoA synthetase alpha subunit